MVDQIIRPTTLPPRASPVASEVTVSDNGASVAGVTWTDGVNAALPAATKAEAEAGVVTNKRMEPLTTKQAIDAQVPVIVAAAINDLNLGTMSQETASDYTKTSGLSAVALSNDYDDLDNLPTLGTAAATDATDYATAAQGIAADTAVQPGDLGDLALKDQISVSADISATGTPSATTALFGDGAWKELTGGGDMLAATYDPDGVAANVFDLANHDLMTLPEVS